MSGHKQATVTINQEEFSRLRDIEVRFKSLMHAEKEKTEYLKEESLNGIRSGLGAMQNRQARLEQVLANYDGDISRLEAETGRKMMKQQVEMYETLNEMLAQNSSDLSETFHSSLETVRKNIDLVQSDLAKRLTHLENAQIEYLEDQDWKYQVAHRWLSLTEAFLTFIRQNYNAAFFLPGRLERAEAQLAMAIENYNQGIPEAGISITQSLYLDLSELRAQLEVLQNQWQFLLYSAWDKASQIYTLIVENQEVPAIDLDGNELPVNINVDYWTDGSWEKLYQEVDQLLIQLEDQANPLGVEPLKAINDSVLPDFEKQMGDLLFEARIAVLNSQLRINIADLVIQSLYEQGFELEDANYSRFDQRRPFRAQLINYEGAEVKVVVQPTGKKIGQNEIQLESSDQEVRTDHELKQRWLEIDQALTERGLSVGKVKVQPRKETTGQAAKIRQPKRQVSRVER